MLKSILKKLALTAIFTLIIAPYSMVINPAYAGSASLSFSDPSGVYLIRGCTGQIQIRLDSGGENVLASDTTTTLTGDATLNSGSIGSALPMQTYNIVNGSELKLSGARYASTGAFTGSGTFGTISITPNATGSISLDFTGDLSLDNNIVNDSIVNVLGSVTGATYTVNERYNVDISGGFCTPDTTAPTYTLADPTANSTNNAVDTDVSFTLTDNRVGVNITTLSFLIDGVSYTEDSAQVTYQENSGSYLVTTNPDTDFSLGSKVDVTVSVCDNEGNCLSNQTKSFYTTPPPSCGNEVIEGGEECDNGMGNHDLDTCTSTCQNAECGDGLLLWGVEECDGGDNCTEDCLLIEEEVEPVECAECAECEAAVHEAAPDEDTVYQSPDEVSGEDQEEAAAEASDALSQQQTSTGVGYGISIPDQVDTVIQNCMELYPNLNFEEGTSEDSDGDGLSNRTECYNGTLPDNSDTDGDSCTDGDEVNTFQTNPLIVDCDESDIVDEEVIITDPQAGWIVRKLEVHGITPEDSDYVDVVAFPAEYSVIQDLMNAVTDVVNSGGIAMNDLMTALNQAQSFVDENSDYEYGVLQNTIRSIFNTVNALQDEEEPDYSVLENKLSELENIQQSSIYLGRSIPNPAVDTTVNGNLMFSLFPSDTLLEDNKLYDLVATATLDNGGKISSVPIRISVDSNANVNSPTPNSIGGVAIPGTLSLKNLFIDNAIAQGGMEIEITESRPSVAGSSEFGTQVFAVWESVILASSVIADSEEGSFAIEAPRNLETDSSHKVTLYAVKANENGDKLRSENVDVYFRISGEMFPWHLVYYGLGILFVLILLTYLISKRLKAKPKAPEAAAEKIAEEALGPMEEPMEGPVEGPMEGPMESPVEEPTPAEEPKVEEMAHEEAEEMGEEVKPMEEPMEGPVEGPIEEPVAESAEEPPLSGEEPQAEAEEKEEGPQIM